MALGRETRVNLLIGSAHFLSHFYMLCLPALFVAWQPAFGVSFAEMGLVAALMSGTTAILQTPVGFLVDRHGARKFLIGGCLLMSLSFAAMGFATAFWQIQLLAVFSGIGNSVFHPADYAILSGSIAKERMGRSFAFHTFTGNLGFAAGPFVMALLIAAVGWREGVILLGLLGVPAAFSILLQSRILAEQPRKKPNEAGSLSGRDLLMSRPMLLFFAFFMLSAMAGAGIQSWLITVLHAVHDMDLEEAAVVLTGWLAGSTAGTLLGGWLADRLKQGLLAWIVGLTFVSTALILVTGFIPMQEVAATLVMFVAGITLGASRTPRDVMVRDAAPPGQIGKVFGFISAGLPLGSALTPVPFGFLIDHGHPQMVFVLVAILLMLSLLCGGGARSTREARRAAVLPAE